MRILSLALRHYRGIAAREVELAPTGVTIVQGPNEVGKSSLAEAVELLFEERDDTAKKRVREVAPADRDAGAEVEARVALGPYRFRYAKRFHRRPETRLAVEAPRVETLTGREAHERVAGWLAEHLDVALWRALRLVQGAPLAQPALGGSPGLAAALDRAAGTRGGGEREETLFDAARAACEEHYTPTGRPRAELAGLERAAREAAEREQMLRAELDALERAAAEEARGRRRVAELEARMAAAHAERGGLAAELEALRALGEECARLEARRDAARARHDAAVQRARQRGQLFSAHAGAEAEVESLAEALEGEEPAHLAASAELRHVEERLEAARRGRTRASERAQRARRDAALVRAEAEAAALRARLERAERESTELARVRAVLAGPPLDAARVREIERAQLTVERVRARLADEGPALEIDPEVPLEFELDGRRVSLAAGERLEWRIAEGLSLVLPGVGSLRVVAGAGVAEQRKALEHAETLLRGLCAEAGVEDHAGAVQALQARRSATEERARAEQRLAEALGGATPEALAVRARELAERSARERAGRSGVEPLPASVEAADHALEQAESADALAREDLDRLTGRRDAAADRFRNHEQRRGDTRNRLELAERNRRDLARRLADARDEMADEVLEARREKCEDEASELEARATEAATRLAERDPEGVRARAEALHGALASDERERNRERDALLGLRGRLEEASHRGLFERWQAARRERERAERDWQGRRRRAEAAARLYAVLREERETARSHYAAPLAAEIVRLGRPLFGADFDVELDDELRVARRVLGGLNLSEAQLSAGAREQLALLARIAAARLAGGVPLWIDDALGHTDPTRLAALGPLLAAAAETSQVVVLTCDPERFRSVPAARVVELG